MNEAFVRFFEDTRAYVVTNSPSILIGLVTLVIFIFMGSLLRRYISRRLFRKVDDRLLINFVSRLVFLVMVVIGIIIFLNQIGLRQAAGGLLAGAGVSAIILGFAFKDIGENFLAGFFLAFSRPFGIGDVIEVESLLGTVKALSFRNTHIRTFDGKDIYLPNGMLIKNPLINYTRDGLLRYDFLVGIDYDNNIMGAAETITKALAEQDLILNDELHRPSVLLEEFGASTVNLRAYYWINAFHFTGDILLLRTRILNDVLLKLQQAGFELPSEIVELKLHQEDQPIPLSLSRRD